MKMLQLITSSLRTFIVIDALNECTPVQRFRLFDSLKEILENSPSARIFVTGRPRIRAEIETRLAGLVTSISVGPARGDIIKFLRVKLSEDETPDAMDFYNKRLPHSGMERGLWSSVESINFV